METLTIETVKIEVAKFFNLPVERLSEDTRKKEIVKPRQIAMFLSRELKIGSDEFIGSSFNRDRTSVVHSCKTVVSDCATNKKYAHEFEEIDEKLKVLFNIERWRPIYGFEDYYEASNFGNIRSVNRVINLKNGFKLKRKGKIRSCSNEICLNFKGKILRRNYLRLIASTWIPNPHNLRFAIKKDIHGNNHIDNIEWSDRMRS
jgi:hypothetical protein